MSASDAAVATLPACRWQSAPPPTAAARQLAGQLELPLPLANLLVNRGYGDPVVAASFLAPLAQRLTDATALPEFAAAAARICETIAANGEIVVYGDFDADGVVATALLCDTLQHAGARVRHFIPERQQEGYGLTDMALERCLAEGLPALLITVDCGMGASAELATLAAAGTALIITDHHTVAGTFPDGAIVINPHYESFPPSMKHLCGAGVAFHLARCLVQQQGDTPEARQRLGSWLAAVATATVADVVPLKGDNRTLVAYGLQHLNRRPRVGLSALMREGGISNTQINSYHLGFVLGPRLNAAGRMQSALPAFRLLATHDSDEARALAIELEQANSRRKMIEERLLTSALAQLDDWFDPARHGAVVVGEADWPSGVVGIVAARLMQRYQRPAAVIALEPDGSGRGSLRAGDGYHAVTALEECRNHLERLGGHARAAGFSLKAGAFASFRDAFAAACHAQVGAPSRCPALTIDGWLEVGDLNQRLLEGIDLLEPFGEAHPRPCWGLAAASFSTAPQQIGSDGKHLRFEVATTSGIRLRAVWFGAGHHHAALLQLQRAKGIFDIAGTIERDTFRGGDEIQMLVNDLRPQQ